MSHKYLILIAALPLALSACSKAEEGEGREISIDLSDKDGASEDKIQFGGDGDGEASTFSIKADGFSMDVDLPSITLDSDDFDMNNVPLYPGSKVTAFNVEDKDGAGGKVTVAFVSPVDVSELSTWFETKMTEQKFEVTKDGNNLSGKTDEGDPFSLMLEEKAAGESLGKLQFTEK